MNNLKLSIVLPVYNECENLKYLIPQLHNLFSFKCIEFEIIIVDDNSNDGTVELLEELKEKYKNIFHIIRSCENSLPMSIFDGVQSSKYQSVMWLDADGSMDSDAVEKLFDSYSKDSSNYYIGSRFVSGGGYKGQVSEKSGLFNIIKSIKNSEDSFLAIYLLIFFNMILKKITNVNINDLTSGFIIGDKKNYKENIFNQSNYGEYFIYLIADLLNSNQKIYEVGYYCKPRIYGNSKTSNNILRLIRLGLPYIKAAIKCKKKLTQPKK